MLRRESQTPSKSASATVPSDDHTSARRACPSAAKASDSGRETNTPIPRLGTERSADHGGARRIDERKRFCHALARECVSKTRELRHLGARRDSAACDASEVAIDEHESISTSESRLRERCDSRIELGGICTTECVALECFVRDHSLDPEDVCTVRAKRERQRFCAITDDVQIELLRRPDVRAVFARGDRIDEVTVGVVDGHVVQTACARDDAFCKRDAYVLLKARINDRATHITSGCFEIVERDADVLGGLIDDCTLERSLVFFEFVPLNALPERG